MKPFLSTRRRDLLLDEVGRIVINVNAIANHIPYSGSGWALGSLRIALNVAEASLWRLSRIVHFLRSAEAAATRAAHTGGTGK